nr:MAG TPA: upper collar protein [Caudoviricetes sp.]
MKNPYRVYEKNINQSCNKQDIIEFYFFNNIMNLFVNRFKYTGLPDTIEPFFIERTMFFHGLGSFIHDDVVDAFAFMKVNLSGMYDIYNVPEDRWAYANNGYMKEYGKDNSVIMWDSATAFPYYYTASMYAETMANVWRTRDINMFSQRTPVAVVSSDDEKLSYQVVGEEYSNYVPVIKISDTINIKNLQAITLGAPYVVDKLEDELTVLWGRVLTDLGYESNPSEKRERLISDEVAGNNGHTEGNRNLALALRERAIDACNKLFGWNAKVEFRSNLPTPVNAPGQFLPNINRKGDNIE